jgi:N-methylhydantoinase A/oxoprolinase/acetone carboxylase beta subunit
MVEAVDVHTVGLGGDSEVRLDPQGHPLVGPRRVVPLCLLASRHPQILRDLERQLRIQSRNGLSGQFLLSQRRPNRELPASTKSILMQLASSPRPLADLVDGQRYGLLLLRQLQQLEGERLVMRAGFTPTDALHVLGRFERWDSQASHLGARLLATKSDSTVEDFCERVATAVSDRVATELVTKVLTDEASQPDWQREPAASALLARALGAAPSSDLECRLGLRQPVVAVGAPVEAYLPRTSDLLDTDLIVPPNADVGNAIGAVVGGVVQQLRALIRPVDADLFYRLYLSDSVHDFHSVEEAVAFAKDVLHTKVEALARQAGADQVEVQMSREDRHAPVEEMWGQDIYLETELVFTATGRPSVATAT